MQCQLAEFFENFIIAEDILLLFISVQFYDAWKGLCDWLDDSSKTVTKFMVPVNQGSATKQNIDDLKVDLYVYL